MQLLVLVSREFPVITSICFVVPEPLFCPFFAGIFISWHQGLRLGVPRSSLEGTTSRRSPPQGDCQCKSTNSHARGCIDGLMIILGPHYLHLIPHLQDAMKLSTGTPVIL